LVYRDPQTREFVPGLAESWQISADNLVYDFSLRQAVFFHDGIPFNAESVAINFARIFATETASKQSLNLLQALASYQVIDEFTFRIILIAPFEPLLDSLSQFYLAIASPGALAEFQDDSLRYQFHQVGTGAFRFVEYLPEDHIIIERNPDYAWKPGFYGELPENAVRRIEFRFFRDPQERLTALKNGEAQIMSHILPDDARTLANDPLIDLQPVAIAGQPLQFYINTQKSPTDDLRIRQALVYAINRTAIVDAVFGGFSPVAWGPISAETLFYNRGVVNVYAYNLDQARSLLQQAGYGDANGDTILDRNGEALEMTLLQTPTEQIPEIVGFLQEQWRSIGIHVNIIQVSGETALRQAAAEGNYNLVSFDQTGLDPYIISQNYFSNSPNNWSGYQSTELDSLLLTGIQSNDREERRLQYGRAQALIMEQTLILPLRDYVNLNAHVANIKGLQFDANGWFPLLYNLRYVEN
jgi:peptide/nickel transport system substrate-binding protein